MKGPDAKAEAASLPAMLAGRAVTEPEQPWLFWRGLRGWTWCSFAQAADQVGRAVQAATAFTAIALDGRCEPDQIVADLAAQSWADFVLAVDVSPCGDEAPCDRPAERVRDRELSRHLGGQATGWLAGDRRPPPGWSAVPTLPLPARRSRLETWRPVGLPRGHAGGSVLTLDRERRLRCTTQPELLAAGRRLEALLPPLPRHPIAFSYQPLSRLDGRVLAAWTLLRGAAWAVEDEPRAWLSALLWTRPHLAWIDGAHLGTLTAAYAERRVRRHSRLRAVVVAGAMPEAGTGPSWTECRRRLGCEMLRFLA